MSKKKKKTTENAEEKPEREVKVVYYDDNSTVADMSGTRGGKDRPPRLKSTWREKMKTFFAVQKKMVVPLLCTLAAFTILYIILQAITGNL